MPLLRLLDFQQRAANKLIENALEYYQAPDKIGGRVIPYVGQLKAVTGAGKTPILATVVSKLKPSIVLWTTKFGSVVDQTAHNLAIGGKYHHLLGPGVDTLKFSDIKSAADWDRLIERADGLTILVSTVAAWNSSEKDPRLNVHRVNLDWGEKTRWEQLKTDRRRPLWVVCRHCDAKRISWTSMLLLRAIDSMPVSAAVASLHFSQTIRPPPCIHRWIFSSTIWRGVA
jgi:type III restriction enzyme